MATFLLSALLLFAQAPGTISGRITSADKKPVADIRVMAVGVASGNASMTIAQTDGSGNYRLEDVPPGRYYIAAGLADLSTYYPGVTSQGSATIVSVMAGASLRGIDIAQFRPAALKVSGRVVLTNARAFTPMPDSVVVLRFGDTRLQTVSDAGGAFEFGNVRPGSYQACVTGPLTTLPVTIVVEDRDVIGVEVAVTSSRPDESPGAPLSPIRCPQAFPRDLSDTAVPNSSRNP